MKKIFVAAFVVFAAVFCGNIFAAEDLELKSQAAVLIEADSGRVLWEKNSESPMAMASTTKIMTAVYTIEHADLNDTVTVSKNAAAQPRVKLFLSEGEEARLKDLLYALMLKSSNDAAVAIAEHISGSSEEFCRAMTEEAKKIGARDTVFETPNGLDSGDHHSTASDMALITRYALKNETFREIIKTPSYSFETNKRSYSLTNADRLLTEYQGAVGVKTGYTGKAGHCFVGAAEREGMTLISVVLASGWGAAGKANKWADTKKLLDYGFDNYKTEDIVTEGETAAEFHILNGDKERAGAVFAEGMKLPLKEGEKAEIKIENIEIEAPVYKGDIVGKAEVYISGALHGKIDLISAESVERHTFKYILEKIYNKWLEMTF
ncbi:MAG: D-alanyl-D-alanine carboxypeptidase [Clostridiales bacterium]|nr:D-alanyl-D-alanine carboxypeptidase [Clostridiales bacterium]